jgi:hypothetical protein
MFCLSAGALVFGAAYVAHAAHANSSRLTHATPAPGAQAGLADLRDGRRVALLESTALDDRYGDLAVVPLGAPDGPRTITGLRCARVDFAVDRGVCLAQDDGLLPSYSATIFDRSLHPLQHVSLSGVPSRVRLSPNGRIAATTVFAAGHSYQAAFSTATGFLDTHSGVSLGNLEQFSVTRGGAGFHPADENFWGVTFASDSNHFYATMATGGSTYLIAGELSSRQAHVVHDNVECPSLSPDNTRIAFKRRVDDGQGPVTWRFSVLDLQTMREWPLAETRSVDDQMAWLDNGHLTYGVSDGSGNDPQVDTWEVAADGSGSPQPLAHEAASFIVATF